MDVIDMESYKSGYKAGLMLVLTTDMKLVEWLIENVCGEEKR